MGTKDEKEIRVWCATSAPFISARHICRLMVKQVSSAIFRSRSLEKEVFYLCWSVSAYVSRALPCGMESIGRKKSIDSTSLCQQITPGTFCSFLNRGNVPSPPTSTSATTTNDDRKGSNQRIGRWRRIRWMKTREEEKRWPTDLLYSGTTVDKEEEKEGR